MKRSVLMLVSHKLLEMITASKSLVKYVKFVVSLPILRDHGHSLFSRLVSIVKFNKIMALLYLRPSDNDAKLCVSLVLVERAYVYSDQDS